MDRKSKAPQSNSEDEEGKEDESEAEEKEDATPLAVSDYYLSQALNLLKGMNILHPRK